MSVVADYTATHASYIASAERLYYSRRQGAPMASSSPENCQMLKSS
ncbi:MAG: hypothetical protein IKU16_04825 [Muribaculaceae bacterium]|nr:hypothetical protein [Muribaculaceae bacterium]